MGGEASSRGPQRLHSVPWCRRRGPRSHRPGAEIAPDANASGDTAWRIENAPECSGSVGGDRRRLEPTRREFPEHIESIAAVFGRGKDSTLVRSEALRWWSFLRSFCPDVAHRHASGRLAHARAGRCECRETRGLPTTLRLFVSKPDATSFFTIDFAAGWSS